MTAAAMLLLVALIVMFFSDFGLQRSEAGQPEYIYLTGTVRDFREQTEPSGHPDFENRPDNGWGHYGGIVHHKLDSDGKPRYTGKGFKITEQWRDAKHRPICYALYDDDLDDVEGSRGQPSDAGITSDETFEQWFRDVPGVNLSQNVTLRLEHTGGGVYVFDDRNDPLYADLGGFFPIDDLLFGNSGRSGHNYHFTFEIHAKFTYDEDGKQFFKFEGNDDIYVYIDGDLVIDLGGQHAALDQYCDLSRLDLEDGEEYTISIFYAERHRPDSHVRFETNLFSSGRTAPRTVSPIFD